MFRVYKGFRGLGFRGCSSSYVLCAIPCSPCSSAISISSSEDCRYLLHAYVSVTPPVASLVKREGPAVEVCSLAHNPSPC